MNSKRRADLGELFEFMSMAEVHSAFDSAINRHLNYGSISFSEESMKLQQEHDRMLFENTIIRGKKLLRPERGDTSISHMDLINPIPYRSAFERICKAFCRGYLRKREYHDLNISMRFASPILYIDGILIYAHFEMLPWNLGRDPRVFRSHRKGVASYLVDPRYVLTVEMDPDAKFIDNTFDRCYTRDYPGRMSWKEFISHPLLIKFFDAVRAEVRAETKYNHPLRAKTIDIIASLEITPDIVKEVHKCTANSSNVKHIIYEPIL